MRMLVQVEVPHEAFNAAIKDGSVGRKIGQALEEIKPEAVYFSDANGHRCAVLIVDMQNPVDAAKIAEPWFLLFGANVHFHVCMTPQDLMTIDFDELAKKWS